MNALLFFGKSTNRHLNPIFYWKLAQLLLGGIIVEKLTNWLWEILYYFGTRVPTPNNQHFLHFVNMLSMLLFRFIIAYLFLYIVILFLFGCCQFWQRNEFRVQFISARWSIQDIHLPLYIHYVPIPNNHPNFYSL